AGDSQLNASVLAKHRRVYRRCAGMELAVRDGVAITPHSPQSREELIGGDNSIRGQSAQALGEQATPLILPVPGQEASAMRASGQLGTMPYRDAQTGESRVLWWRLGGGEEDEPVIPSLQER